MSYSGICGYYIYIENMKHTDTPRINTIGQKIKFLRKSRQWSQHEVATRLQISIPAFSKIEAGITTLTLSRIHQLVDVFETNISVFTGLKNEDEHSAKLSLLTELREKIAASEAEIAKLQRIAISLYEELEKKGK